MSSSPEILSDFLPSPTLSNMTAVTLPSPPSEPADFDAEHYWDFVTFNVQERLFRVPKYKFVEDSEYFSTVYDLEGKLGQEFGLDDPHLDAVKLEDVTIDEFKTFLRVLYPRNVESPVVLAQDEWTSILDLATKWRFGDLRKLAMGKIESVPLMTKIDLAERLTISSWLVAAYTEIATRDVCIALEEGQRLGIEKALQLCQIKEKYFRGQYRSTGVKKVSEDIDIAFSAEFEGMRKKEAEFYPTKAERKVIEEAKAKVESEAKRLADEEALTKMTEEAMRVAEQYDKALDEQRAKLAMLEQEKERALSFSGVGDNSAAAGPAEGDGTEGTRSTLKKKKSKALKR